MSNKVLEVDTIDYNFNNIKLGRPVPLQTNVVFSKITDNDHELLIQMPIGRYKGGIKQYDNNSYNEFILPMNNTHTVEWFENIDVYIQEYLYNYRDTWFNGHKLPELHDIEDIYRPTIKSINAGKSALIRAYGQIPTSVIANQEIPIFDENGNIMELSSITEQTDLISILHVQGLKMSPLSIQLYIGIKQIVVIQQKENIFNKMLISNSNSEVVSSSDENSVIDELESVDTKSSCHTDDYDNLMDLDDYQNTEELVEYEPILKDSESNNIVLVTEEAEELDDYNSYDHAKQKLNIGRINALELIAQSKNIRNSSILSSLDC